MAETAAAPIEAGKIQLELVSPERLLMSEAVTMAVLPGAAGQFGVLVDHIPLISSLEPGVIDVYETGMGTVTSRIFIAGGFAEVDGRRCIVLAEDASLVDDIDETVTRAEIKDLKEDLEDARSEADRLIVEQKLKIAHARLVAVTGDPAQPL